MAAIGSIIANKYEVVRLIGEGGMSQVYLAMDTKLNKQWAIKEIKPVKDLAQQEIIRQSLVTETNMIKQFDHPALPRITDLINENNTLYVVMDYIEGESLIRVLTEQGPQSQEDVIEWGKQLCDALDYLHTRVPPVIYRDMKPGNIMLKPDGTVKIIDFGIAREYREEATGEKGKLDDTTMLGTKGYAAPEQFGGFGQTDARTDVYCLGATMYHLLTGKSPAEPPYIMHPIRQIDPSFSPGLEKIITKATQQNPDNRYDTCAEMLYELENFETIDDAYRKKLKRKWYAFVSVCAAAILSFFVGVFGVGMAEASRSQDYDSQINLAHASTDQYVAQSYYQNAITLKPENTQAYLELIDLYRSDGSFSADEEAEFLAMIIPNIGVLESQGVAYAELSFEVGRLYWYYYSYAADAGDNRLTRIKSAAKWMNDAAANSEFENVQLAEIYASIADFNSRIVTRINEGGDQGMYESYFRSLEKLNTAVVGEKNDVVLLETSAITGDALQAYARKFRADGILQAEMEELQKVVLSNAGSVYPTTDEQEDVRKKIIETNDFVLNAIKNAFVDARLEA